MALSENRLRAARVRPGTTATLAATALALITLLAFGTAAASARSSSGATHRTHHAAHKRRPGKRKSAKHKSAKHKSLAKPSTSTSTSTAQKTSSQTTATGAPVSSLSSGVTSTVTSLRAPGSVYWGAVTGTQFDHGGQAPWDMNVENDFVTADAAGKRPSIIPWYEPFTDCSTSPCTPYVFPTGAFENARSYGAIPMISWASSSLQDGNYNGVSDRNYTLAGVADGKFDTYITAWAQAARAWGHPFFLRFDWEMNGDWFVWGANTNTNTAAQYVAAWRHIHDIFVKVGATNASWVWCPNNGDNNGSQASMASFYPGSAYVDWTCMDAYNFGTSGGNDVWQSWNDIAASGYAAIQAIAPTKPMMIAEFNSATAGGSQAAWLTQALSEIPTVYPDIHAIVLVDTLQWQLESHPLSEAAFGVAIHNSAYTTNAYGNLDTSPIPAP